MPIDLILPKSVSVYIKFLEITNEDEVITLKGVTNRYYVKQMAQETIKRLRPKSLIKNQIQVVKNQSL